LAKNRRKEKRSLSLRLSWEGKGENKQIHSGAFNRWKKEQRGCEEKRPDPRGKKEKRWGKGPRDLLARVEKGGERKREAVFGGGKNGTDFLSTGEGKRGEEPGYFLPWEGKGGTRAKRSK